MAGRGINTEETTPPPTKVGVARGQHLLRIARLSQGSAPGTSSEDEGGPKDRTRTWAEVVEGEPTKPGATREETVGDIIPGSTPVSPVGDGPNPAGSVGDPPKGSQEKATTLFERMTASKSPPSAEAEVKTALQDGQERDSPSYHQDGKGGEACQELGRGPNTSLGPEDFMLDALEPNGVAGGEVSSEDGPGNFRAAVAASTPTLPDNPGQRPVIGYVEEGEYTIFVHADPDVDEEQHATGAPQPVAERGAGGHEGEPSRPVTPVGEGSQPPHQRGGATARHDKEVSHPVPRATPPPEEGHGWCPSEEELEAYKPGAEAHSWSAVEEELGTPCGNGFQVRWEKFKIGEFAPFHCTAWEWKLVRDEEKLMREWAEQMVTNLWCKEHMGRPHGIPLGAVVLKDDDEPPEGWIWTQGPGTQ